MRIALFGGSFNPPHIAHQMVGLYVLETAPVDELWFVPAFEHAFDKPLARFEDRLRMCELAVSALGPRARVSDIEAQIGGPSRTLHTVRKLIAEHPGWGFSLVIGSDLTEEIATWYGAAELRRLVGVVVVARGLALDQPAPAHAPHATRQLGQKGHRGQEGQEGQEGERGQDGQQGSRVVMPGVSSSAIRAALADGQDVSHFVPRAVLDYIALHGLYRAVPAERQIGEPPTK